jgi:hypothetical protein
VIELWKEMALEETGGVKRGGLRRVVEEIEEVGGGMMGEEGGGGVGFEGGGVAIWKKKLEEDVSQRSSDTI